MTTNLGKKLAQLSDKHENNVVLAKLLRVIHGETHGCGTAFNDREGTHTDYVNNRTGGHTDTPGEHIPCPPVDDEDYTDRTYGDGTHYRHEDTGDPDLDSHINNSHSDYSDVTR